MPTFIILEDIDDLSSSTPLIVVTSLLSQGLVKKALDISEPESEKPVFRSVIVFEYIPSHHISCKTTKER